MTHSAAPLHAGLSLQAPRLSEQPYSLVGIGAVPGFVAQHLGALQQRAASNLIEFRFRLIHGDTVSYRE